MSLATNLEICLHHAQVKVVYNGEADKSKVAVISGQRAICFTAAHVHDMLLAASLHRTSTGATSVHSSLSHKMEGIFFSKIQPHYMSRLTQEEAAGMSQRMQGMWAGEC